MPEAEKVTPPTQAHIVSEVTVQDLTGSIVTVVSSLYCAPGEEEDEEEEEVHRLHGEHGSLPVAEKEDPATQGRGEHAETVP